MAKRYFKNGSQVVAIRTPKNSGSVEPGFILVKLSRQENEGESNSWWERMSMEEYLRAVLPSGVLPTEADAQVC